MAHVTKYTKAAIGHICNHYGRSEDLEKAKYVIRGNDKIDASKTCLNYNLAEHQRMKQIDFIHQRLSEVKVQKRKDVNVLCDWVVTAPKDLPTQEHKQFFKASYDFLERRYGKDNVISAYVHMDESQPHMHFAFVPVKQGLKQDKNNPGISTEYKKVSAKEVITRYDLKTFHPDLQKYVEHQLGHEVGILNEATKDGNKSIAELKRQSATERLQEVQQEAHKIVFKAQKEAQGINDSLIALKTEYEVKKAYVREADKLSDISVMYPTDAKVTEKGLIHKQRFVTVPAELWESKFVSANEKTYLQKAYNELEKGLEEFKHTASAKNTENIVQRVKELEVKNATLNIENRELTKKLNKAEKGSDKVVEQVNKVLNKLPNDVSEQFIKAWNTIERTKDKGFGMEK